MPKNLKQQSGNVVLVVVITIVIMAVIVGGILYAMGVFKLPGKLNPSSSSTSSEDVQVKLETKYENPFDKSTQYQNPFSDYQNPFDQLE